MADDVMKLGFDFSKDIVDLQNYIKILRTYNLTLKDVDVQHVNYDKHGQSVSATMAAMSREGLNVAATFTKMRDEEGKLAEKMTLVNVAIKNTKESMGNFYRTRTAAEQAQARMTDVMIAGELRLQAVRRENTIIAQREQAASVVQSGILGSYPSAQLNTAQLSARASAAGQLGRMVQEGQLTVQTVQNLQAQVASGTVTTVDRIEQRAIGMIRSVQDGYTRLGDKVLSTNKGILLSWTSMARLFEIQILHNMFWNLIIKMREGMQEATKLSQRIGEVMSIAQSGQQLPFAQWEAGIRKLSDTYGKQITDVAEGVYQTLSYRVAEGTKAIQFQNEALKFSVATMSTAAQSTDVLTAAIDAYRLKSEDAHQVAESFFRTVQYGRLRVEDLAGTMGRVLPMAAAMGISLNDVNAALATLTIEGMHADEATTLLNNVLLKLINPTAEMKKMFAQWGVASGEAAIEAFGLAGVLNKLYDAGGGADEELVKVLGRFRAIRGAIGLTGQAMEQFAANKAAIENPGDQYEKGYQLIAQTPGFQLQQEMNKLKNMFVVDFGQDAITKLAYINKEFVSLSGSVESLSRAFIALAEAAAIFYIGKPLITGIKSATLAIRALAAGTLTLEEVFAGLNAMIGVSGWVFLGIATLTSMWQYHNYEVDKAAHLEETLRDEFEKTNAAIYKQRQEEIQKSFNVMSNDAQRLFAFLTQYSAQTTQDINSVLAADQDALAAQKEGLKTDLDAYIKDAEDRVTQVKDDVKTIKTEIADIEKTKANLAHELAKNDFQTGLESETDPLKKVFLIQQRMKDLQADMASKDVTAITGGEDLKEYLSLLQLLSRMHAQLTKESKDYQDSLASQHAKDIANDQLRSIEEQEAAIRRKGKNDPRLAALEAEKNAIRDGRNQAETSIKDLQGKLKSAQDALAAMGDTTSKKIGDAYKLMADSLEKQLNANMDKQLAKVRSETIKLEQLKDYTHQIDTFSIFDKSGKLKYTKPGDVTQAFDQLVAGAKLAGMGDKEYQDILTKRNIILAEANNELASQQEMDYQHQLIKYQEFIKQKMDLTKTAADAALKSENDTKQAAFAAAGASSLYAVSKNPFDTNTLPDAARYQQLLGELGKGNLGVAPEMLKLLQDLRSNDLSALSGEFLNRPGETSEREKVQTQVNNATSAIDAINKAVKAQSAYQDAVVALGLQQQAMAEIAQRIAGVANIAGTQVEQTKKLVDDFHAWFMSHVDSEKKARHDFMQSNPPVRGFPGLFHDIAPNLFSMNPYMPSINNDRFQNQINTTVGAIHIHGVPITGNTVVDPRALVSSIRNEMRQGLVRPLNSGDSYYG